jgi:hypothetical protein
MIMRILRLWPAAALAFVNTACDQPTIRDCPVLDGSRGNPFNLEVVAKIPSNCPVPLGQVGEEKFVGADVIDHGASEARIAEVQAKNSHHVTVGSGRFPFVFNPFFGWTEASSFARYPAATGNQGGDISDRGWHFVHGDQGNPTWAVILIQYRWANMIATVRGPDVPIEFSVGTWDAPTSGGSPPYTYEWYRDGQLVSTGSSYTANVGDYEFGLRAIVTDQTTASRWADYWVDVNGVRAAISGPVEVYESQGGGTWTVEGRGGSPPYTFTWYKEDASAGWIQVATGPSYSGYPGHGGRNLKVEMRDSRAAVNGAFHYVNGICIPDGGVSCPF